MNEYMYLLSAAVYICIAVWAISALWEWTKDRLITWLLKPADQEFARNRFLRRNRRGSRIVIVSNTGTVTVNGKVVSDGQEGNNG